ncbi:uncharacterized protein TM35_000063980 [Trypanosoma theileri]|uniref:Uncharacterized protein n=1 Tax=Trypanosoma theileri TaxID=67003 RepID=A0A1X0P405_9TRYP|nr:uncharacterized protein TM35_000063980 [Trypanosoma theileri]ORC91393.1 hypothetical protein TM35_000063980 [Trypanosoma theileri]
MLSPDDKTVPFPANGLLSSPMPVRRRMGDVYPIMKGSIYEDDDCYVDTALIRDDDFGGRIILYFAGVFQLFTKHPRIMGFLLTSAILLLFFKYSQVIVVKAVHYALSSHPGLETSDDLRSSAVSFSHDLESFVNVAKMIAWSYQFRNISGYDINTLRGSAFLNLLYSYEIAMGSRIRHAFVLYEIPSHLTNSSSNTTTNTPSSSYSSSSYSLSSSSSSSTEMISSLLTLNEENASEIKRWGQVGCMEPGSADTRNNAQFSTLCAYVDPTGRLTGFNGTNVSNILYTSDDGFVEHLDFVREAQKLTPKDRERGVWQRPNKYQDRFYNQTLYVMTFVLPIHFDSITGKCTAVAGVEVSLSSLAEAISVPATNTEVVLVDTRYLQEEGGQFVVDTIETDLLGVTPFPSTATPRERINTMASTILRQHGGKLLQNGSFFENGLVYQSLTLMDTWMLFARSPLVLSAAEVHASLRSLLTEHERLAAATMLNYESGVECELAANEKHNSRFLEALGVMQRTSGSHINSLYVAYQLTNTTTTTTTMENVWGACGCFLNVKLKDQLRCFYTNSDGMEISFDGVSLSESNNVNTTRFNETPRGEFVKNRVQNITSISGEWTKPYVLVDPISNTQISAFSFIQPSLLNNFNKNGPRAAAIVDLAMSFLPEFLNASTRLGTTGLFLIDRRDNSTFMGTRVLTTTDIVYPGMNTPNKTINRFTTAVYEELGGSFNHSISFSMEGQLVNYEVIEPHWGLVEIIPADVALFRFLPSPSVRGATDALRLIPTGETVLLFLFVAGIFASYMLNLLILGCSKLGKRQREVSVVISDCGV